MDKEEGGREEKRRRKRSGQIIRAKTRKNRPLVPRKRGRFAQLKWGIGKDWAALGISCGRRQLRIQVLSHRCPRS
ncbi:hypothetical protein ASPFODRAFT_257400 [Aspergillus luchuensis CBS 106.47]|uniref:Uncharacterized protein n=1 Tax=Aspergillus luchuensis (strain CBS 106.47) TaxID=1137211 RepID=A0A1M3TZY2_ASPLC|nr:hypothetical protein ASPFODRAFT_257400 [Aspergillus luchuensis CBS 106.47]